MEADMRERFETVIVGGGQAGLAVGYHLARAGRSFVILEANPRIGDSWRNRWDSLRLFTPASFNGLPGMPFPAPALCFSTKDAVADFMAAYAARFQLPVRTSTKVESLDRDGERYVLSVQCGGVYEADNVVVATGPYERPKIPAFASELDPRIVHLHSSAYRNPGQLPPGEVLIVGAGNSGAEISADLSRSHQVWLAGRGTGEMPFPHGPGTAALVLPLMRVLGMHVLTVDTPLGRKMRPRYLKGGGPLVRIKLNDLVAAGVRRVPRVAGVRAGLPLLADGRVLDVASIVWCTGFRHDFDWIHLPLVDGDGEPRQYRGVVASQPGLYVVGLGFLYSMMSSVLAGVGRDARYVANHILSRSRAVVTTPMATIAAG
jgi:putative flavoprotein involved in K+ transport